MNYETQRKHNPLDRLSKIQTANLIRTYLHFREPQEPFEYKVVLDEETARMLYSRNYTNQRSLSQASVHKIYSDLKKGNRHPDNQICLAVMDPTDPPFVVDGQHRLAALVRLAGEQPDFSFPCRLYLNYPKEQLQYIDQQRPRSAADIAKMTGKTNITNQKLSIVSSLFLPQTLNPNFSRFTTIECCQKFYEGISFGVKEYKRKGAMRLYLSSINAVQSRAYYSEAYCRRFSSHQEYLSVVERFFYVLGTGDVEHPEEAKILELRMKLLEYKLKFGTGHRYFFALTQLHLSAFLKGNKNAPRKDPYSKTEDGKLEIIVENLFPCFELEKFYRERRAT